MCFAVLKPNTNNMSEKKTNNDSTETTPFSQAVASFSDKVNKFKVT